MPAVIKQLEKPTYICPQCGFPAKSPSGLVNHERLGGCMKLRLKYQSMQEVGVFGEFGILAYDPVEDKVQCHICGKWFHFLAGHIKKHGMSVFEYKEDFGLNRNHALCGRENSRYRSRLCQKLRLDGKFNLLPPPPRRDFERRLEIRLKKARRIHSGEERRKMSLASKTRLKRYKKQCVRCGANFWIKVVREEIRAKYCPACRHLVELEHARKFRKCHHERIRDRERILRLVKREGLLAQRPTDWAEYTHNMRSAKAKEIWQRPDAYNKRSVEIKCSSCGTVFRVLAFNKRRTLCPECHPKPLVNPVAFT